MAAPPVRYLYFFLSILLIPGCAKSSNEPVALQQAAQVSQQSKDSVVVDPSQSATLKGRVLFEGPPPMPAMIPIRGNPECAAFHADGSVRSEELLVKDGALQNVFVYIKGGLDDRRGVLNTPHPSPTEPVTIENKNCTYVPHVSGVQVGQPVILLNDDPTLHNIHSYSKNQKNWNLGLPFQGMKQTKKFSSPEVMVQLKCDVHPWMVGYVGVLPHPYFAVSREDGTFEIKNLPAGNYVAEAWHEKLGVQTQEIKLEPREVKEIKFRFKS